jgi:hypothetical protein
VNSKHIKTMLMAMTKADIKDEASRLGVYVTVKDTKQEMIASFIEQTNRLKKVSTPTKQKVDKTPEENHTDEQRSSHETSRVKYEGWSKSSTLSVETAEKTTKGGFTISVGLASVPLMWVADILGIVDVNSENIAGGLIIILWWIYSIFIYVADNFTDESYPEYVHKFGSLAVLFAILAFVMATIKWLFGFPI